MARDDLHSFFDAHCHLQDQRLLHWLEAGGAEAIPLAGIERMVVNGTDPGDWERVRSLAERYDFVQPSYGLHPWRVNTRSDDWFERWKAFVDAPGAAVGEIGLDRWIRDFDMEAQKRVFLAQYRLAKERNLPVSIHCLRAWGHLYELLKDEGTPGRGFLLHSYGGPLEMADSFLELGARFSFSGYFAEESKASKRAVFKEIPLDRLLIETDAPDMLGPAEVVKDPLMDEVGNPINSPLNLPLIYDYVVRLRAMESCDLVAAVKQNFQTFFG